MSDYMNTQNMNVGMDWDDVLENDGMEYVLLPEGDYNFTVTNFERGRFPGSAKMAPCNKASLTLQVKTDDGPAFVRTDLILNRILEWKIASFFRSIGLKKHGERLVMNWNKVLGSHGRAHFKPRNYTDDDGTPRQANNITKFYDYDPNYFSSDDDFDYAGNQEELPF